MAKSRTTPEYVSEAKRLSEFYPALRKYRNRKRLSRGEKAVIGKAISDWNRRVESVDPRNRPNYVPLTAAQARKAGNALPRNNSGQLQIRAIDAPPGVKKADIRVKAGELVIMSRGQSWRLEPVDFTQDAATVLQRFQARINAVQRRNQRKANRGLIRYSIWTAKGPGAVTRDADELMAQLEAEMDAYRSKEDESDDTVFFGLGYALVEG